MIEVDSNGDAHCIDDPMSDADHAGVALDEFMRASGYDPDDPKMQGVREGFMEAMHENPDGARKAADRVSRVAANANRKSRR